ncbi:MAG TPA: hypothetical protein VJ793_11285 [Anaerolineae bacterium]|nr:hypothetical protein [Anaerolineae bacterium]
MFHVSFDAPAAKSAMVLTQVAEVYLTAKRSKGYEPDPEFLENALEWLIVRFTEWILPDVADHLFEWSDAVNRRYLDLASVMERCANEIRRYVAVSEDQHGVANVAGELP